MRHDRPVNQLVFIILIGQLPAIAERRRVKDVSGFCILMKAERPGCQMDESRDV
jgi:hypothetical protein